jgi:hypothetical protein
MNTKTETYETIERTTEEYEAVVWDYEDRVEEVIRYLRTEVEGVNRVRPITDGHGLFVHFSPKHGNGRYNRFRVDKGIMDRIADIMGYSPEVISLHRGYAQRNDETAVALRLTEINDGKGRRFLDACKEEIEVDETEVMKVEK